MALSAMLLCGFAVALESSEDTLNGLKMAMVASDMPGFVVPTGTNNEACRAYWRMSSYQSIERRYQELVRREKAGADKAKKVAVRSKQKWVEPKIGDPNF